jgi:hypothetical protein
LLYDAWLSEWPEMERRVFDRCVQRDDRAVGSRVKEVEPGRGHRVEVGTRQS